MCCLGFLLELAFPSLHTLAISAFAVVEHWLLFFVASLLLDTLGFAFAIAGRWLLFYPLHMDYVPAALVVLLSCSLENRGLQLSLSLSLMHPPYPSAFRRFKHVQAADSINAYLIGAYWRILQWRIGQWTWSKPNRKELINASAKNHACTAIVASTSFNSCSHWLKLIVAFRNGSVMGSSCSFLVLLWLKLIVAFRNGSVMGYSYSFFSCASPMLSSLENVGVSMYKVLARPYAKLSI